MLNCFSGNDDDQFGKDGRGSWQWCLSVYWTSYEKLQDTGSVDGTCWQHAGSDRWPCL